MSRRFSIIIISLVLGFCSSCNTHNVTCYGNCYTGFGEKKWSDGGHDKGNWKDGEMVGYGEQYFGSTSEFAGDTYAGQFGKGGYNGYGKYYSKKSDGMVVGYWKKGKPNGYGKSTFKIHSPNPVVYYDGNWKDGKPDGFGKMNFDNGKIKYKYEGDFVDGLFDGMGDFYPPDGTRYIGHFSKGFKDGEGVFYFNDGEEIYAYKGTWVHDESEAFEKFRREKQSLANYISTDSAFYFASKRDAVSLDHGKIVPNSKEMFKFKLYQKHIEITQSGKLIDCNIIKSKPFTNSIRYYLLDQAKNHFQISVYSDSSQIRHNMARIEFDERDNQEHPFWLYIIPVIKQ